MSEPNAPDTTNPQFPVYIPSKGRADTATTPRYFDRIGVPYRLVIEESQRDWYAEFFDPAKLLILDPAYIDAFDTFWPIPSDQSKGSGPARNFIWDHAVASGAEWHWTVDDNITLFARLHENQRIPVGDGTIFAAMENFTLRYTNVGMSGPHYWMFAPSRAKRPPFITGTRIYSCNLIRNDLPFRWRGRYNEDTDLSLRLLKAGWNTILFSAFLQWKVTTQHMRGGNTDAFYANEGTLRKSQMLVDQHPDCVRLTRKYGRWHHHADYSRFARLPLLRREDWERFTFSDNLKIRSLEAAESSHWAGGHAETPDFTAMNAAARNWERGSAQSSRRRTGGDSDDDFTPQPRSTQDTWATGFHKKGPPPATG